ncbi:MAG: SpoIIE family protein phosphatase [Ruminococcus sp.]|nr:SpoIIE family protein phosphatase [Ruminococcus sp.]
MKKHGNIKVRTFFIFLLMTAIVSAVIGTVIFKIIYSTALEGTEKQLVQCSEYVRRMVSPDSLENWLEKGKDEDYSYTWEYMSDVKNTFGLSYLFIYKLSYDSGGELQNEAVYLFDIMQEDTDSSKPRALNAYNSGGQVSLGERRNSLDEYEYIKDVVSTGEYKTTESLENHSVGRIVFAFYPIKDDSGKVYAVIGAGSPLFKTRNEALSEIIMIILIYLGVMAVFVTFMLVFMHRGIIKPVKLLSDRMNHFVTDFDEHSFIPVTEIRTHDEIEQMAQAFNKMSESILTYTNDLKAASAEQERMKADLAVAGGIRSATSAELSYPAFPERSDFELYASLKNTVYHSCSFCNYILSDEDHLYIVIGESIGNTLPAMLMSMLASTNIKCLAKMGYPPYRIAAETNDQLCAFERSDNSLNVSALIAEIELSTGTVRYVNAGMPPMLIKRPGEKYEAEKLSIQFNLGEMRSVSFAQEQMTLSQGSSIILTSYGVPEMKNIDGERFTAERVQQEINDIASSKYFLNEMIDELEARLDSFRGGSRSELDTTVIGFRYFG